MTTSTPRHPSLAPAHPGELLAEVSETQGVSIAEMARRLGVTRAALYKVLEGRSSLTADMAVRVENITGTSPDLLVRMQAGYDLQLHAQPSLRARNTDRQTAYDNARRRHQRRPSPRAATNR